MESISWLHLTDLHRGMTLQQSLWANVETEFFNDLGKLHDRCGPWDVIFFTGDLTQKGKNEEFEKLNDTLNRLYRRLAELGSNPTLLVVPGNHDLLRPKSDTPAVKLLKEWTIRQDISEEFWRDNRSPYRAVINKSFKNYMAWLKNNPFPKPRNLVTGLLPGDFAATIEKGELKLGVIGLNVTFLQLTEGDYEGKLALNALQLNKVCGDNYDDWFKDRDINLLITHQPPNWLNPISKNVLDGEIYRPDRFVAHMYGHMHEHGSYNMTIAGAHPKRYWQGCSLFGLESYGKEKQDRRHGYAAGRIDIDGNTGKIRLWPRTAMPHQAGHWHIVPDPSSTLTEDECLPAESFKLSERVKVRSSRKANQTTLNRMSSATEFRILLLATDTDLANARDAVADYLRRTLGVEVTKGSTNNLPDPSNYELVILLQGWWWDNGEVAKVWGKAPDSKRLAFIANERSEWPPRLITELNAGKEISNFRDTLDNPTYFDHPKELPEQIGASVTAILQNQVGDDGLGLQDWEREYLAFRLPAWKSGRTALSPGHLLEADNAEELYQADLYIPLDGTSRNWQRDSNGRPKRLSKKRNKKVKNNITEEVKTRVRLAHWLSVPQLPRIALVGAPGGGKTVFLTRIASAIANSCLGRPGELEPDLDIDCLRRHTGMLPIPVVLEATRIARNDPLDVNGLIEAISEEIASMGGYRPQPADIHKGLKSGRYFLLIDALDEIADSARRSKVLDLLKGMADSTVFPHTRLVLTTRSARYTGRLRFGPELEIVEVASLDHTQIAQLCNNWSRHRVRDNEYTQSLMAAVSGLTEQVRGSAEDQAITENPLMLTAICMVFERYRSLPDDRGRLCELLIDDLCRSRNSEDSTRDWKLDDATKKDLLQRIALAMQEEGTQTWPVSRAIEIATSLVPAGDPFIQQRAKKYVDWAADHTGLLRFLQDADGEEHIRFWHRLFREYLAANRLAQLDKTASDMVGQLWEEERLVDPFWEDVIRLLPRPLGTIEKAKSLREQLERLAQENPLQRGRLLGLAMAGIIENRDLYPDAPLVDMAHHFAEIYEIEAASWDLRDRLLFLSGLGRLDLQSGDPRLCKERWIKIPQGSIRTELSTGRGKNVKLSKPITVPEYEIAWAPVTVQEYRAFIESPDFRDYISDEELHRPSTYTRTHMVLGISDQPDTLTIRIKRQLRYLNRPVIDIKLGEAIAFCHWRTQKRSDRRIVRLPTEAEWLLLQQTFKEWINTGERRNILRNDQAQLSGEPTPVGTLYPNLDLPVDISGNIWQWCNLEATPMRSRSKNKGRYKVFGGLFDFGDLIGQFAFPPDEPDFYNPAVGFRCALI